MSSAQNYLNISVIDETHGTAVVTISSLLAAAQTTVNKQLFEQNREYRNEILESLFTEVKSRELLVSV